MKRKRVPLIKQFAITFGWIMILSLITSFIVISLFFDLTHLALNNPAYKFINQRKYAQISQYISKNGLSPLTKEEQKEFEKLIGEGGVSYYISDGHRNILFWAENKTRGTSNHRSFFLKWHDRLEQHSHMTYIHIPILDRHSGKSVGMLTLFYDWRSERWFFTWCEIILSFTIIMIYTLIFAFRLSRKIRAPLRELMNATDRIKSRNLDFSIQCDQDNEIGDLARALEDMRSALKGSLIKEWQLEQDRRDMVAALTHDLRTPLAIIQGHIEGLQGGLKDDRQKLDSYLEIVEKNIMRVKDLVDEMNVLTEVEDVGFTLEPSQVNLRKFIQSKADELRKLSARKGIRIDVEVLEEQNQHTMACLDYHRLAQVMENIIGNSIRFTPENGLISIRTKINREEVFFQIDDTGPGFSENDIPHLFKKFYKGDRSRSVEKGHSGLGMHIAKTIVERHGGMMKAYNRPEGGARVEFSIRYVYGENGNLASDVTRSNR